VNALLRNSLVLALAAASLPAIAAEPPKAAPAKPLPPRSVFVVPSAVREGRDPFFPESTRPYEDAVASKHTLDSNSFAVKGLSIERGRAMVIINNHTFAVGDEGDVLTTGGRVHLRLVEIRPGIAVIEVNGSRRELSTAVK
jgi:hypothetical protein